MSSYHFSPAIADEVPVVISVPHCGTEFPDDIRNEYDQGLITAPDDTDWFVDRLYDFAPSMGMPLIAARYSRWVIDLNRDPRDQPLYSDGRIITALCPTTTFLGESLYNDHRQEVTNAERQRRLKAYFWDYHHKIRQELDRLRKKFGIVLLWDCHSIRQLVPTIHPNKFPDLILGDADGTSASHELTQDALACLRSGIYGLCHNDPFKGGFITRSFGRPKQGIHALQLEMTKVNYMDRNEVSYDEKLAGQMKDLLKKTFGSLIERLKTSATVVKPA